jgi:hypothetical protein
MSAIIFAGPSLPPKLRPAADPSLEWRPPVRQGELYQAALARPSIIGVIDGYFEVVPTVWHKEILWAMAEGIHVYGAASAGALRAAELDSFGMQGIGRVYEDFRDGVLQDDDEVAVLHGPEELGYPPITEAMVNIRATLDEAARSGIIAHALAASLTDIAKRLFYKGRCYEAMMQLAAAAGLPEAALQDFADWLPDGRIDQKRLDAAAMLTAIRAHLAGGIRPMRVSYRLADTAAWQAARRGAGAATTPTGLEGLNTV